VSVFAILALFCILAIAGAKTFLPQPDEAAYANGGYNIAYNGNMGTTLYELHGFYMPMSLAQHTYWQPPLYFFSTALWFRILGFGLLQVRAFSILFGLLCVASWYWIVRRLTASETAGLLAMALVAVDYFFLLGASTGRMDIMCCGLGSAALAAYMLLRERSLPQAFFWSHLLATLSIVTHGAGILYWLSLVFLILTLDRRRITLRALVSAAVPALAGMVVWGLYILQDPRGFLAQTRAIMDVQSTFWDTTGLSHIPLLRSFQLEWQHRYRAPFGLGPGVGLAQRLKALVLMAYTVPMVAALFFKPFRRRSGLFALAVMTLIAMLFLAAASPSKFAYYLPHVTTFMAASLGAFLFAWADSFPRHRWLAAAVATLVIAIQLAGIFYRIRQDPYHRSYMPAIALLRAHTTPRSIIMATGEVWFGIDHDRFMVYDPNLGKFSGMTPDAIVWAKTDWELQKQHEVSDPVLFRYVQHLLDTAKLAYKDENYLVYLR
jgi:4-amino-4-deoxy-L-arabinose transferase-like glycosyltransferase